MPVPRSLSVFFPAHNEVDNIGPLTEKTVRFLRGKPGLTFEVIIVNDGSTDGTRERADELARAYPEVRAVHHDVNKGYGGAVWTGIRESRHEAVFFTDGDGQFDVTELDLLFPHYGQYDAVFGYRIKRADPLHRLLFAKAWGLLIRILFGFRLRDLDCAFKLIRRDLLADLFQETAGAMVTVELLAKLTRKGLSYTEVGVHHYPRRAGVQSGGSLKVILRAFRELFKTYWKLRGRRPALGRGKNQSPKP
ncbi:glycosyltransferase family 2 protein [bacterium]|nr:glycosyltransferase family 2 protein [bacterium]